VVAALLSAGEPAIVVIARSADLQLDASAVLKALQQEFGGKGGGKPELAQGGGLAGPREGMTAALGRIIESLLQLSA
jgi:alanyl-tRNA synthetase